MNSPQFIHFGSGAAGTDLKPLVQDAFGQSDEWENQLIEARALLTRLPVKGSVFFL